MKAKHHFWSSLALGGGLWAATGHPSALGGAMIGGFLIDADHVIDQLWSISKGAGHMYPKNTATTLADDDPFAVGLFDRWLRRRKLVRLPLLFHSYELLCAVAALGIWLRTPFVVGLAAGYVLHLGLDLLRHHREFRSPLFYLILYRVRLHFRRDRLIKPEYL